MTTQTVTLTEFLLARIAEDEADALRAPTEHAAYPPDDEFYWCPAARPGPLGDLPGGPDAECECGVRPWKPNPRVLAECAAKRRIVELHFEAQFESQYGPTCHQCFDGDYPDAPAALWPCSTIRALASVYADHPDYREEWA